MEHPTGLTIDFAMDHMLYWVDTKLNLVEAMREDGTRRRTIISGDELMHPYSLDVFESSVSGTAESVTERWRVRDPRRDGCGWRVCCVCETGRAVRECAVVERKRVTAVLLVGRWNFSSFLLFVARVG